MSNPQGSALVTRDVVLTAFEIAGPSIHDLLRLSDRQKPVFVHIVVLNPIPCENAKDDVLGERTFGDAPEDRKEWKRDYAAIARSKAEVARRLGDTTAMIAAVAPALFKVGDTHFEGGVCLAGVPGGGSGAESWIDEVAATFVVAAVNGLAKKALTVARLEPVTVFLNR